MAKTRKTTRKDPRSRRFTDEQRRHALTLVASGMTQEQAAKAIGTTANSIWLWRKATAANGTLPEVRKDNRKSAVVIAQDNGGAGVERVVNSSKALAKSPYAPADPAHGLSDQEVAAILECKTKHLSMGP
ncbi:MAG: helix-turn-helix domain-containing protein, partial [Polyangiaceae bacterium]|nr:helix-turn-helix domain-containing protein [Polyangiaceae bacterium]